MQRITDAIARVAHNHWLNAFVGILLMWTGLAEAGEALFEDVSNFNLGAHHGIIVLGFVHAFKSIPSILGGIALLSQNKDDD